MSHVPLRDAAQTVFLEGSVWLNDLGGLAQPTEAIQLGRWPGERRWLSFPYETLGGITGSLLYTGQASGAAELQFALPVRGWYRIYLGLPSTAGGFLGMRTGVHVRLETDPAFYRLEGEGINWFWEIGDHLWKEAWLDHTTLHLKSHALMQTALAWVRLEPMSEAEIEAAKLRIEKRSAFCGVTTHDGYAPFTLDDFYTSLIAFRESNIRQVCFSFSHAEVVRLLPTRVGRQQGVGRHDFMRPIDRQIATALDELVHEHPDVLAKILAFAHRMGLSFHAGIRPGACYLPGRDDHSAFLLDHPEYQCRTREGTPVARLSFAAPPVQDLLLDLFDEWLTLPLDGLNLIFIRALPATLFEDAFLQGFEARHALDARTLDDDDPRLTGARAEILTGFLQRVRERLDEAGRRHGKRLELSLTVPATEAINRRHGLALRRWAETGLVDFLLVDSTLMDRFHSERIENIELAFFERVCAGTACRFYPKMIGGTDGQALLAYDQHQRARGAAGIYLWDGSENHAAPAAHWEYTRLVGAEDTRELEATLQRRPPAARLHLLKTVDGFDWDQFPPHNGY